MRPDADELVMLGAISGVHGVRGWVKVRSFTEPRANIGSYPRWRLHGPTLAEPGSYTVEAARTSGRQITAKLAGVDDRDQAALLVGCEILVRRRELPACASGEYYWQDLEGMRVQNRRGEPLGEVDHLIDTGAHAVLVLAADRRHMIPFVGPQIIIDVDLDGRIITVDWERSFWD